MPTVWVSARKPESGNSQPRAGCGLRRCTLTRISAPAGNSSPGSAAMRARSRVDGTTEQERRTPILPADWNLLRPAQHTKIPARGRGCRRQPRAENLLRWDGLMLAAPAGAGHAVRGRVVYADWLRPRSPARHRSWQGLYEPLRSQSGSAEADGRVRQGESSRASAAAEAR